MSFHLAVGRSGLLAESSSLVWPKTCTDTGSEQAEERKEEACVVEELEVEEPSCEGDRSTGLEAENGGPRLLSLGTGEELSRVVVEKVIGELGITGGVTEEPKGKNEGIYPKISNPVIQLEPS
jgi:hypothetical protein